MRIKGRLVGQGDVLLVVIISSLLLFFLLIDPILVFSERSFAQQSYETNFFSRTVITMVDSVMYHRDTGMLTTAVSYFIAGSFLLATFQSVYSIFKNGLEYILKPEFILYLFGISIVLISTILHHLFGTRFLDNRLTVFIFPLAMFVPIYLVNDLYKMKSELRKVALPLAYLISLMFILNTVTAANFTHYVDWKYDASTNEMMKMIKSNKQNLKNDSISIGINWFFEPSVNYYRSYYKMDWVEKVNRNRYQYKPFDYYYIVAGDSLSTALEGCKLIKEYPVSNTHLYRRLQKDY
jgi:hypothetical protein